MTNTPIPDLLRHARHDLRSPINAVLGYGDLLQKGVYGSLNEGQAEAIDKLLAAGHRLEMVVQELLERLESDPES